MFDFIGSTAPVGEIAALCTACCWVVTSLAFAKAGLRVGSLSVNMIRLAMALPLLGLWTLISKGQFLPTDANTGTWLWLSASGLIGFVFGDMCLFRAFVLLGARLSSLIMAVAPLMTAVIGYLILGEGLGWLAVVGMAFTIAGVIWAVLDRKSTLPSGGSKTKGVILAFGGALGQAVGLVLSKYGMAQDAHGFDAFAATQIRVIAALGAWIIIFSIMRHWAVLLSALKDSTAVRSIAVGSVFGPALGVGLSLYAVQHANTGVAASLMSITPILLIPITVLFYKERVGWWGIFGTLLAVAGVVILFL